MADYAPGTRLADRFEVKGVLGRGGMATVYLVEDETRGDRLALKVLHPHLAHDPAMIDRLRREVAAARRVRHPAALVAHDLHALDGTWALTMPYHSGRSLAEALSLHGALSADRVRSLGLVLAEVLALAHGKGVLHRDVSPANVMIDDAGNPQLTDFGLARVRDDRTRHSTGMMGTAGYTAPEVWGGKRTDPRSDLYSLGAVLYEAAAGRPPFDREPMAALQQQLGQRFTPLAEAAPALPGDLASTIEALLQVDIDRRPSSARELADALRRGEAVEVEPAPPIIPDAAPQPTPVVMGPALLPEGDFMVAIKPRRDEHRRLRSIRRALRSATLEQTLRTDAPERRLAKGVSRAASLPDEILELSPALVNKKGCRLVDGVDRATAERLARTAEMAGYEAQALSRKRNLVLETLSYAPLLIPFIWVAFPFVMGAFEKMGGVAEDLATLALPLNIMATILFSMLAGLGSDEKRKLPLAYGADLEPALKQGAGSLPRPTEIAEPVAAPEPASDAALLAQRTRERLQGLSRSLERAELPAQAEQDLRRTVEDLLARTQRLSQRVGELEEALLNVPVEEGAPLQQRLERLETRKRAGEPVRAGEEARLRSALETHRQDLANRDSLEGELTGTMASLLEIGAAAARCRRTLLAEPMSAHDELLERLRLDTEALTESESELRAFKARNKILE